MIAAEREVLEEVRRIFAAELERKEGVGLEQELARDLLLDSVQLLTLVVALENRFRILLAEEDAGEVRTVGDLVRLVALRREGGGPAPGLSPGPRAVAGEKIPARLEGAALPPLPHATLQAAFAAAAAGDTGLIFWDAAEREIAIPWSEAHRRARRFAAALAGLGVRPGDRVALILPTAPDFIDAFFGALLAGAVPVPLYPPVRLGRLADYHERTARMLRACGARLLLTDRRIRRLLGEAAARARPDLGCIAVEDLAGNGPARHVAEMAYAGKPDELALIQFSSGTTVDPKPVALSHRAVLANVAAIESYLPENGALRQSGVSWLPLYHDMGLIGCLLQAMVHRGPLTLIPPELFLARPAIWLRAVAKKRATVSPAPNFAFGLCLRRVRDEELEGLDLSSWRLALNGAEPIAASVLRRFGDRFARFGFDPAALLPVYGLSEASLAVSFSQPGGGFSSRMRGGREVVSVGRPVPGTAVEIRNDEGELLSLGEVGRIHIRSPALMDGYFERPDATAAVLRDGWLDSGDLGFIEGGELHVSGRAKDLIVLRGANHAPQTFEECLDGIPGLRQGCAVAVGYLPDGGEGEELAILAERAEGEAPDPTLVAAAVLEATGIRAHAIVLLEPGTLPRTSSGKLRRGEARRQWLEGSLAPPSKVTPLRIAGELLRSQLAFARSRLGG